MSSARWVGRATTASVAVLVVVAMLAQSAAAQEAPPESPPPGESTPTTEPPATEPSAAPTESGPEGPTNGPAAIEEHEPELDEIAARYDMSEAELREELASDESLHIDDDGRLLFIDPAHPTVPQTEPLPAPAPPFDTADTFTLHSNPTADRTIYLDFVGSTVSGTSWNGSGGDLIVKPFSLDADGSTFSPAEHEVIQSVWQRVSEDFAPFDVDVTTEPNPARVDRTDAGDLEFGTRVVFAGSGTTAWATLCSSSCGGIAYIDVFDLYENKTPGAPPHAYYQPAFVFQDGTSGGAAKSMAEAATHEAGHNLNLHHDGRTSPSEGYYSGHGVWAPIMGVGYSKPVVQWSKGEYGSANNPQDDLADIAAAGAPLRGDDHGDATGSATAFPAGSNESVTGTISHEDDVDVFSIEHPGGLFTVHATPAPVSPNLDIEMTILDGAGTPIDTVNPTVAAGSPSHDVATGLDALFTDTLAAGTYHVRVDGVGHLSAATGYTDYASLGTYTVQATLGVCGSDDDLDDDDSTTTTFLVPGQSITGKRCADDDWIRVPGLSGVGLSATLTVLDDDLTVDIMDAAGANVLSTATATTAAPGATNVAIPANADHYIRITGSAESRYTLDTSVGSPVCPPDDKYEGSGDNQPSTAKPMSIPGVRDSVACGTDFNQGDFISLSLTAGRKFTAVMDYESSIGMGLQLHGPSPSTAAVAGSSPTTDRLTLTYTPTKSGTYWLWARTLVNSGASQYHLETSQADEQPPTISAVSPSTADVGTDVTITGTNFGTATDVDFTGASGPLAATFTINSLTSITATVPDGAVDGPITVTNGAGSATSAPFDVDSPTQIVGYAKDDLGDPVTGTDCVRLRRLDDFSFLLTDTPDPATGEFRFVDIDEGTYTVDFTCAGHEQKFWLDGVDQTSATPIGVETGTTVTLTPDVSLARIGTISGTVTDATGSVGGVCVGAVAAGAEYPYFESYTTTAANGTYTLTGVEPGSYHVAANHPNCGAVVPNLGVAYLGGDAGRAGSTVVDVAPAGAEPADFTLPAASTISGTVSGPSGPIAFRCVEIYAVGDPDAYRYGFTDASGAYSATNLGTGGHQIRFCGSENTAAEWHVNAYSRSGAAIITLSAGSSEVVDATLSPAGSITGTLSGSTPGGLVCASAYDETGQVVGYGGGHMNDTYTITGLTPGNYRVGFEDCGAGITPEFYEDKADLASADTVTVTAGNATTADAQLEFAPVILQGVVTGPNGAIAAGSCVRARDEATGASYTAYTNSLGQYGFRTLPDGTYTLRFGCGYAEPYQPEYHDNAPTYATATPIVVSGGSAPDVDAQLAYSSTRGVIIGSLTDDQTSAPIAECGVEVFDPSSFTIALTTTAADGTYAVGLDDGPVRLGFGCQGYVLEYHDDVTAIQNGTLIPLPPVGSPTTIDAALTATANAGRISGAVTGEPNDFVCVDVLDAGDETLATQFSVNVDGTGAGSYTSPHLRVGSYVLRLHDCVGGNVQFYDEVATFAEATPVAVTAGTTTTGIDLVIPSNTGSISGTLTGPGTLADVCVSVIDPITQSIVAGGVSDSSGNFTVRGVPAGTFHVGFACGWESGDAQYMIEYFDGSATGTFNYDEAAFVDVIVGATTDVSTELDAAATISGTLTSSVDGISPANGACVNGYPPFHGGPFYEDANLPANASGEFSFPARVEGFWQLSFGVCRPDGWKSKQLDSPIDVTAGGSFDASTELDPAPTGAIEGTVVVEGAETPLQDICVSTADDFEYVNDSTSATGEYGLYELPDGTYTVYFDACGAPPHNVLGTSVDVVVSGGAVATQDVTMLVGSAIEGHVSDASGGDIGGVCVTAYPDGAGTGQVVTTVTDGNGDYRIEQLDIDTHTVRFSGCSYDGANWVPAEVTGVAVSSRPSTTNGIDMVLEPGASVEGTVTESAAGPINGLCVEAFAEEVSVGFDWTDFTGRYRIEDLAAGTYDVVAGDCFQELYIPQTAAVTAGAGASVIQDFALELAGKITGAVDGSTDVCITAVDSTSGDYVNTVCTVGGDYELFIPAEDVKVRFDSYSPTVETLWYDGAADEASATPIAVPPGGQVDFVNAVFAQANTPPEAYFVFPNESPVKGVIDIQVDALDLETAVDHVDFFVDGELIGTTSETDGDGYWSLRWNSAAHGDGQIHTFEAIAYDTEGLDSTPAMIEPVILSSTANDFDGDGTTDIAMYRPATGYWYPYSITEGPLTSTKWGNSTDIPVPADYNGDGTTDIAMYRPANKTWYVNGIANIVWGATNDIPVPADFDGDGTTDIAMYRPATGYWYPYSITEGPLTSTKWGNSTDIPVPADYNGDGTTDIAVYRPANKTWYVNGIANIVWGATNDTPLSAPGHLLRSLAAS